MAEKTNNTLIWVIGIILVLLGVVYFATTDSLPGENQKEETGPIKVGVILPLSGDSAVVEIGELITKSYNLAVEEINNEGGVDGRQLELVYEDGGCDPEIAKTAAEKLVNDHKVEFILGGTCSEETLSAAKITEEAGVLLLSPSSASPEITTAGDLVFRTYPSYDFGGKLMAEYAVSDLEAEKVAILYEESEFDRGARETFINAIEDLGAEVVFDESFETGEIKFRTLVNDLKDERPDVIFISLQDAATGELILKQINDSGVRGEVFATSSMLERTTISKNSRTYRDLILTEINLDKENEKTADFLAAFEDKYGEEDGFSNISAAAYDSVYLLAEGIEKSGTDPDAVAEYFLENIKDWPGALGNFSFDENGDVLLELNLLQVQRDGSLEEIER